MTVPAQTPVSNHVGNGVTTAFAFGYKLLDEGDIVVSVDSVVKTIDVDYTVSGVGVESGGTVTFTAAPAALAVVALVRQVPINRLTDYQYSGDFESPVVNRDFDRLVMMLQDSGLALANALRFPPGDESNGFLPSATLRALKVLGFDAEGNIVLSPTVAGDATSLALELASSSTAVQGAGMVGYDFARLYAPGTIGSQLNEIVSKDGTFVSVKDKAFGAVGDGVTNDDAARALAEAASSSVYWPEGTYILTNPPSLSKSWGPGKCYVGGNRVYLRPTAEPATTVFSELMDVPITTATDAYPALQRAVDFAQANKLTLTFARFSAMRLSAPVIVKQGSGASTSFFYELDIHGNDATIGANFAGHAIEVQPQCLLADKATGRAQGVVTIDNLRFYCGFAAGARAIRFGRATYFAVDLRHTRMRNVQIDSADLADTVVLQNYANIIFENCGSSSGCGWSVVCAEAGGFTGDCVYIGCQWQGTAATPPLTFLANNGAAGNMSECRGHKFQNCNLYGGANTFNAGTYGAIADIWFVDCGLSFEGAPVLGMIHANWNASATGGVYNIVYRGNYIAGWAGTPLRFTGNAGAQMFGIIIDGNTFGFCPVGTNSTPSTLIHMNGFNGAVISNNHCHGNSLESLAYFLNARGFSMIGNRSRDGTLTNAAIVGGTSENFVISGNAAYLTTGTTMVNDFSSGANKSVVNNLNIVTQ